MPGQKVPYHRKFLRFRCFGSLPNLKAKALSVYLKHSGDMGNVYNIL